MTRKKTVAVIILLLGLLTSGIAWAHGAPHAGGGFHGHHHHHGHFHGHASVVIGAPWAWPGYYRPPPYYAPYYGYSSPVIVVPASPPVYIEQGSAVAPIQQQASAYWYYCNNPQGYYPSVKACPAGWQPVPAQPPRP